MEIIAQNAKYILADCRGTHYTGDYQLLKITQYFPSGATIGVYFNKKDAVQAFNEISNSEFLKLAGR